MSSKKNPHRKQSWVGCEEGFEVLYDGAKTFWRTRKSLDVLIVSHPAHLCIELITYDAEIGKEAPRLYLNSMMLRTLVDAGKVEEKLGKLKEVCNRQKKDFDRSKASKEFFEELMVEYIVNKLNMGDVEDPETEVKVLVGNEGGLLEDDDADINDQALVRRKPNGLKVVEVNYTKKASAKEILAAQQALLAESRALQHATKMAELMATATDRWAKMLAEKKRISRLSRAKKRWIYAINQVMIANYIQAVKKRLERSEVRDWYLAVMAKAAADEVQRKEQEAEAEAEAEAATAAMREVAQTTQPPPQAAVVEATSTSSIKPSRGSARRSRSPPMRRGSFDSTGSSPTRGRSRKGTSSKASPAATGTTRGGRSSSEKYSGEKATAASSSTSASSSSSSSASSKRAQRRTLDNSDSLPRLNSTTSIKEGKEGVTQLVHVPPPSSSSITAAGGGGVGAGGGGSSQQQQEEESAEAESHYISTGGGGGGEVVHLPLIDAANSTSDSNTTKDSNGTHTHTLAPPSSSSRGGGGGSSNNKHNNGSSNKNNSRHVRRSLPNLPSEERKKSEPAGFEESDPERGQLELEKTTTTTTTIVPEAFVETAPTAPLTGAPGGAAAGMVAPQRRRARA